MAVYVPRRRSLGGASRRDAIVLPDIRGRRRGFITRAALGALLACGIVFFWPAAMGTIDHTRDQIWGIDLERVKGALAERLGDELPDKFAFPGLPGETAHVHYQIDPGLQRSIEAELEEYRPDYGMVVALDARTGALLGMAEIRRDGGESRLMSLKASYPAASVFKTVTAAAAIDLGKADADTVVPYNGKATTLYKRNVLKHRDHKWTRRESLAKSFSKSVNTVFARLGVYDVGGANLLVYADRFGFNRALPTDLPLEPSTVEISLDDEWSVAEAASGHTRDTNISPVHGALLAAAVVNDGLMPTPHFVAAMTDDHGIVVYEPEPSRAERVIAPETANELRKMMRETIRAGTASKSFRGFSRRFASVEVGGKTGSLTGFNPKGKYDWFIGYATDGERKIAYAVLCINKKYWYVKSARLARRLIESYFS